MRKSSLSCLVAGATLLAITASAQPALQNILLEPNLPPEVAAARAENAERLAQNRARAPQSTELVLTADLSARTIPLDGPLFVALEMRNTSPRELRVNWPVDFPVSFIVEVTTLAGDPVAPRPIRPSAGLVPYGGNLMLLPGQSVMVVRDIRQEFEITQPGNYVLRAVNYTASAARAVPVVFSVVEGAQPDARAAAVEDPNRDAAEAVAAVLAATAPFEISGDHNYPSIALGTPLELEIAITNRAKEKLRFGNDNFVRLEVEHPDGHTEQIFNRKDGRDAQELFLLSYIEPGASKTFKTTVGDRFQFPTPGAYKLRFFFPSSTGPYEVPVMVKDAPVARAAR